MNRRDILKNGALLGGAALVPWAPNPALAVSSRSRFSWTVQPPAAAGMSEAGIAGVRAAIRRSIDAKLISGAVTAVARHGKLMVYDAQGYADIDARTPMRTDSLFRMMSSTKVITAVATLMMVEEGRMSLDDPVSRFIPTFRNQRVAIRPAGAKDESRTTYVPASRDITVRDLLTHTSGLSSTREGIVPELNTLREQTRRTSLAAAVPGFGRNLLDFQPGTKWQYSPLDGMDTLLRLVELTSKTPADRFLKERIFAPLGMRSSFFHVPESQRKRLVRIYKPVNGSLVPQTWLFENQPSTYISGAGGLISDAHDMLNFELMLLQGGSFDGRRLLKPETVALMSRNHVGSLFADWIPPITGGFGFGLGVRIVEDEKRGSGRAVGAFGWGGAYGTETWADPQLDMACVMLIQVDSAASSVKDDFARALRQAIVA